MRDASVELETERGIKFLARAMDQSGHNPKPVVLHSGVSLYLLSQGYPEEIILAGNLHHIMEDTSTSMDDDRSAILRM